MLSVNLFAGEHVLVRGVWCICVNPLCSSHPVTGSQALRVPTLLQCWRSTHFPRNEETHTNGTIHLSRRRVECRLWQRSGEEGGHLWGCVGFMSHPHSERDDQRSAPN